MTRIWHSCLRYTSQNGMEILSRYGCWPKFSFSNYAHFLNIANRASKLEMHIRPTSTHLLDHWIFVHMNVCGSIPTRSLGDVLYFITFIDDATRKVWVKGNDDVYPTFIKGLALIELKKFIKLKALLFDNGDEYYLSRI